MDTNSPQGWTPLAAPVHEVVLLEDRAQVLRRGVVTLQAGRSFLEVTPVSPLAVDRSLGLRLLQAPAGCELATLGLHRWKRSSTAALPGELAELQEQIDALDAEARRDQREIELLREEQGLVAGALDLLLAELSEDAAWGAAQSETWDGSVAELTQREAGSILRELELHARSEERAEQLDALRQRRAALARPDETLRASLRIELQSPTAGTCELELRYLVPGACWRPQHRATLLRRAGRPPLLRMECEAAVWQRSGEDWRGVAVSLSTQRPSLGQSPPLLSDDRLASQRRSDVTVVEARDSHIERAGLGRARRPASAELPGIDDGGEALSLRLPGPFELPSDGRPHRLPLSHFETPAELGLVLQAELAPAALLRCSFAQAGSTALLAGPVDLLVDGGRVGRSKLPYLGPGEGAALGFGPDPALRVHRELEEREEKAGALGRWNKRHHKLTLHLSNLGDRPRSLEVVERVPVSEIEGVEVEIDRAASSLAGGSADADGFLRQTVTLPPGGTQRLELRWTLLHRKDLVGL